MLPENLKPYLEDGHRNDTIYRCVNKGIQSKINMVTADVYEFFACERPEYVFLAAAKVDSTLSVNSTYQAELIYHNFMIELNIIHAVYMYGAENSCFWVVPAFIPKWLSSQ